MTKPTLPTPTDGDETVAYAFVARIIAHRYPDNHDDKEKRGRYLTHTDAITVLHFLIKGMVFETKHYPVYIDRNRVESHAQDLLQRIYGGLEHRRDLETWRKL